MSLSAAAPGFFENTRFLVPKQHPMKTKCLLGLVITAALLGLASASTLTVTDASDHGPGTLRDTIAAAQAGDMIVFDPSIGTVIGLDSELLVDKALTIAGPGAPQLQISQGNKGRIFNVTQPTTISGLTLINGFALTGGAILGTDVTLRACTLTKNFSQNTGGAIAASGAWVIDGCSIIANRATNCGGGIYLDSGSMQIDHSTFEGNAARGGNFTRGGALSARNAATFAVMNSTFSNNSSDDGGAIYLERGFSSITDSIFSANFNPRFGLGGAISNDGTGTLTVARTSFTANATRLDGIGGAVYNIGTMMMMQSTLRGNSGGDNSDGGAILNDGDFILRDSTVSGNSIGNAPWSQAGGGIYNDGTFAIANCTIAGNTTGTNNVGAGIYNVYGRTTIDNSTISGNSGADMGGGIFNDADRDPNSTVSIANSILAGNSAASGPDVFGSTMSRGFNLIGNINGGSGFVGSDLINVDPQLGPLQNNGGPTETMATSPSSPALEHGDLGFNANGFEPPMTTDQRGSLRIAGGRLDIGAYENSSVNQPPVITQMTGPQTIECTSPTGTSATVSVSVADTDGNQLTIQWIVNGQVVQVDVIPGQPPITSGTVSYTGTYPLGTTTVMASVSDGKATVTRSTTVTIRDSTPPVIKAISANPNILWPPNHQMVPVAVTVTATDGGDPNPISRIISVTSNEAGTGQQYQITGDLTVDLRAERNGGGNGRIYTITVRCTDMSNNSSTRTVTVRVPKSRSDGFATRVGRK